MLGLHEFIRAIDYSSVKIKTLKILIWSLNQQQNSLFSFISDDILFALKHWLINNLKGKRMARKLLAKCQKQPWQQPCNLIVSHEETFRQFVTPSHEKTPGLKWLHLFSWKNKVSIAQNPFGQNTFKCFFFLFMSVHIPRLYLNIIKKYIFLEHHQWDNVRLT